MKPLSTATVPPAPVGTSWVWAWPPSRLSASRSVTSRDADRTCAAVSPDTPAPITATVGRVMVAPRIADVGGWFGADAGSGLPIGGRDAKVVVQGLSKVRSGMEISRTLQVPRSPEQV